MTSALCKELYLYPDSINYFLKEYFEKGYGQEGPLRAPLLPPEEMGEIN
jgi:hypothetical protein